MDRRYNKYWRLPGAEAQQAQQAQQPPAGEEQQEGGEGGEGAAAEAAAAEAAAAPPAVGDRLLVESQEDGSLRLVTTRAALAALMAALERKGARESGLYASLLRHKAQLEAGMPAGPLALPPAGGEAAAAEAALQPRELPSRSSKKAKEAAAAEGAVEAAAAAELAPLREGDGPAVTRIKAVRARWHSSWLGLLPLLASLRCGAMGCAKCTALKAITECMRRGEAAAAGLSGPPVCSSPCHLCLTALLAVFPCSSALQDLLRVGAPSQGLFGADLLLSPLRSAATRLPRQGVLQADGQDLPFQDEQFDLALQFTAFSSVLDEGVRRHMAAEMLRVLKPGGAVLWYDFWLNPTNRQTRGIRPAEIRSLFPGCSFTMRKITLAPPIARRVVPISWGMAQLLEALKLFNSLYLVLMRKCR